jgi:DNA-binding NarL/FixJ family response regulator
MGNEVIFDRWRDEDSWPNVDADLARAALEHQRHVAMRRLGITRRELDVLKLIADEGLTNREIGGRLSLSEETIKSRIKKLLLKTPARNRAHLIAQAFRTGLLH